jgi:outer membrane protein OmpA-like peptidoglycan-associated protein
MFLLMIATLARRTPRFWVAAGLALSGCAGPVGLYHDVEGGAIAGARQPPPGADLPYPNLASVPAAPAALTLSQSLEVARRVSPQGAASTATLTNPAALAGLALPVAAPPVPALPGLAIPDRPAPAPAAQPAAPPPRRPADGAPVALAFRPGSAILTPDMVTALQAVALGRGQAHVLAGGFGEAPAAPDEAALKLSLTLALNRAEAIADALTAAGVPPKAVRLTAAAAGSGGFVQLVY